MTLGIDCQKDIVSSSLTVFWLDLRGWVVMTKRESLGDFVVRVLMVLLLVMYGLLSGREFHHHWSISRSLGGLRLNWSRCRSRSWLWSWCGLWSWFNLFHMFSSKNMINKLFWAYNIILHLACSMVRVFREVPITGMVVLSLSVVPLDMMARVHVGILVMVNTSLFIDVIIV